MLTEQLTLKKTMYWGSLLLVIILLTLIPHLRTEQSMSTFFLDGSFELMTSEQTTLYSYVMPASESQLQILLPLIALFIVILLLAHVSYDQQKPGISFITGIITALTPTFLALHLNPTLGSVLVLLVLLTTYLYRIHSSFYLLSFGVLFAFDPITSMLLFLVLFIHLYTHQDYKGMIFISLATLLLLLTFVLSPLTLPPLDLTTHVDNLFTFFGSHTGFTLTLLLLGLGGIAYEFIQKKHDFFSWLAVFILVVSSVYEPLRLLGIIILAYFAANSFTALTEYTYSNKLLGRILVLLFICMFLFSTVTFIKTALSEEPTLVEMRSYEWLRNTKNASVLVHPDSQAQVAYHTQLPVHAAPSKILTTRNLDTLQKYLDTNTITHILVDSTMRRAIQQDGLSFLLQNNDQFTIAYQRQIVVYEVTSAS